MQQERISQPADGPGRSSGRLRTVLIITVAVLIAEVIGAAVSEAWHYWPTLVTCFLTWLGLTWVASVLAQRESVDVLLEPTPGVLKSTCSERQGFRASMTCTPARSPRAYRC
jgi:hypothetical protein